jgi:hypothetical protein
VSDSGDSAAHRRSVATPAIAHFLRRRRPSHGVAPTPDEKEGWAVDAFDRRLHIAAYFRRDGQAAEAGGEHLTPPRAAGLKDEHGVDEHRETLLEIYFNGGQPVRTGDQFGIGRVTKE